MWAYDFSHSVSFVCQVFYSVREEAEKQKKLDNRKKTRRDEKKRMLIAPFHLLSCAFTEYPLITFVLWSSQPGLHEQRRKERRNKKENHE